VALCVYKQKLKLCLHLHVHLFQNTGLCWGAGTNVKVTPDLVAGDQLRLIFPNSNNLVAAVTTILDAAVTKVVASGRQIVATGHISPSMNRQFFECRVIAPDLVDTVIGRRDARAEPGPIVPCKPKEFKT
jgi:hypothetical protein